MADYLIGDIQGCDAALAQFLALADFSPSRDRLFCLGDLVNRGPDSLATLRRLVAWAGSVESVLGNHDLHLLAVAAGLRQPGRLDTLARVLDAPDCPALLDWLRQRPLAMQLDDGAAGILLVHAGLLPEWTATQALDLAAEVSHALQGPNSHDFLSQMYGNQPDRWQPELTDHARLRLITNAFTRLRYCHADGRMDFDSKESTNSAPAGLLPWFALPHRASAGDCIAFGHWSTLGLKLEPQLIALDTGCIWGGQLSALRVDGGRRELLQVNCQHLAGHLNPGA